MNVLVTGARSNVGTYVVKALCDLKLTQSILVLVEKLRMESNHLNQEIFGVFDDSELKNTMLRLIQETEKV